MRPTRTLRLNKQTASGAITGLLLASLAELSPACLNAQPTSGINIFSGEVPSSCVFDSLDDSVEMTLNSFGQLVGTEPFNIIFNTSSDIYISARYTIIDKPINFEGTGYLSLEDVNARASTSTFSQTYTVERNFGSSNIRPSTVPAKVRLATAQGNGPPGPAPPGDYSFLVTLTCLVK